MINNISIYLMSSIKQIHYTLNNMDTIIDLSDYQIITIVKGNMRLTSQFIVYNDMDFTFLEISYKGQNVTVVIE